MNSMNNSEVWDSTERIFGASFPFLRVGRVAQDGAPPPALFINPSFMRQLQSVASPA